MHCSPAPVMMAATWLTQRADAFIVAPISSCISATQRRDASGSASCLSRRYSGIAEARRLCGLEVAGFVPRWKGKLAAAMGVDGQGDGVQSELTPNIMVSRAVRSGSGSRTRIRGTIITGSYHTCCCCLIVRSCCCTGGLICAAFHTCYTCSCPRLLKAVLSWSVCVTRAAWWL